MKKASLFGTSLLMLAGCTTTSAETRHPRWQLGDGPIQLRPICPTYRAPVLGKVPESGLVPVYLFGVNGASANEIQQISGALRQNGFVVDGHTSIGGTWTLFAFGNGYLKTQAMADRLFRLMCALESEHVRLVHVRYNTLVEKNRVV